MEAREASEEEAVEDEQEPEGESLHDSEEYDSEEDESDGGHRRKKKKKDRYGGFIIDEAEVCTCIFCYQNEYAMLYNFRSTMTLKKMTNGRRALRRLELLVMRSMNLGQPPGRLKDVDEGQTCGSEYHTKV